ncbi:MAG: aldehyde dehydrogenase family protein [Anaerolineales bacterium]|nr:aldehyde dehydrogenase family protein [Anaerolineales bacterium]
MSMDLNRDAPLGNAQVVGSPHFAELIKDTKATSKDEIDNILQTLASHKGEWAQLEISERLLLLDEVRKDLWEVKDLWINAELSAKSIPERSFGVAEEWVFLAQAFRSIRLIQSALMDIQIQGRPAIPGPITSGPGGRTVMRVLPQTIWDRLIFLGVTGDVWMKSGVTSEEVIEWQAARYRDRDYKGKVALVLGAGNFSMIPICDAFHKLFVDLQVVALKMNPVNAHLGPLMEKALRSLIQRGFLYIVYGGAEVGEYLCNHPLVEELHMTGSDKTYEAIVFGTGPEGETRKLERKPINTRPFTGELGNLTPVIVVPGPWKKSDIDEYAKHIATWLVVNGGFACFAPRAIIQHESWPQRTQLTKAIRREFELCPPRKAYYPGAFKIHNDFLTAHPEALLLGDASEDHLPWTIVPDVDPKDTDDICFNREGFGGLCAEVSLEGETVESYLDHVVDFVNNTLWGTLCSTLIVHPKSLEQPAVAVAVERAIAGLRYGTVGVNMLSSYGSYFMTCPWGAIPGHDIYDIQSGMGKNFNFLMFHNPEKVVLRAPFRRIDPLTIQSKRAYVFAEKLAEFEASPSWFRLVNLMLAAIRN